MSHYAIERDPLLADERPDTLAKRVETVLQALAAASGMPCTVCASRVCPHDALASLVLGYQRNPRCIACLARETSRPASVLRDEIAAFALSKECLTVGWRWAGARDSHCAWSDGARLPGDYASRGNAAIETGVAASLEVSPTEPRHDTEWNAGELACGELVLELRSRLRALSPGSVIKLTAVDPAAPEDIPAWCRLTGHTLVHASHPSYFIRRKED